jgi:hypothetical protein
MGSQERNRQKRIRNDVIERDGSICCYCDKVLLLEEVSLDHLIPDSKGGLFNATNLTVACASCNARRGNFPFFDYIKRFNWHQEKLNKYQRLYQANLKIKILNVAKENIKGQLVPLFLIKQACKKLKVQEPDFSSYQRNYCLLIKLEEECYCQDIKNDFCQMIRIIEMEAL